MARAGSARARPSPLGVGRPDQPSSRGVAVGSAAVHVLGVCGSWVRSSLLYRTQQDKDHYCRCS